MSRTVLMVDLPQLIGQVGGGLLLDLGWDEGADHIEGRGMTGANVSEPLASIQSRLRAGSAERGSAMSGIGKDVVADIE
jgi:hypothetical protein